MTKRLLTALLPLAMILAACQSAPSGGTPRAGRTRTPDSAITATLEATDAAAGPPGTLPPAPRTPEPTFDFPAFILTQAYSQFTPLAANTPMPAATAATGAPFVALHPLATDTPHYQAPAAVVVSSPIRIANAVNSVDCKINGVGECTPIIPAGAAVYFTWTFGVRGNTAFQWGNAAVVIQRDGQQYKWFQANNGLMPPPANGEASILPVGASATFRGGLDSVEPGSYSARLVMCPLSVAECGSGRGWQDVGGDTVQFVVNP